MEKQDAKAQLIEIVKGLYSQEGYASISLNRILKETGLSKGGLYWYFDSKEALFEAAFEECYKQAVAVTRSFDRQGLSAVETLKRRLLELLDLNRMDHRILAVVSAHLDYLAHKNGERPYPYGEFFTDVTELIDQGIKNGEFAALPRSFISDFVFLYNSQVVEYFDNHPEEYSQENAKTLIDRLYLGLTK